MFGKSDLRKDAIIFTSILIMIFLLGVVVFQFTHELYGGFNLPTTWAEVYDFSGLVLGDACAIAFLWQEVKSSFTIKLRKILMGTGGFYATGVLGTFLSDVFRTMTRLITAENAYLVWGAGGFHDLVFIYGIYVAIGFLICSVTMEIFLILSRWKTSAIRRYGLVYTK